MAQFLPMDKHLVEKHTQWRSVLCNFEIGNSKLLLQMSY